tara:strand:- start:2668 stop:3984 length:1317 start_codon:yes stop_codon:yes gene_type:complete
MYKYIKDSYFSKKIFWSGIFFLPSAPGIAFILLFISSTLSIKNNYRKLANDKWNLVFIVSALLMPIICILQPGSIEPLLNNWDKSLTWIGLTNWVLLIFCFLSFQFFVKTAKDRKILALTIISGSIPVIFSGFAQYVFKIYGPFELLNGFIIWFQRPLNENTGMSALFNNQNYAGAWFCIIWPLSLAVLLDSFNKRINKYISLSILISITISIILTTSRSAWGGLVFLIPLMTGISSLPYLSLIIFVILLLKIFVITNLVKSDFNNYLKDLIPIKFLREFNPENFYGRESRIEIWSNAIKFISQRPILGWGAAAFPVLYFFENNTFIAHSHNLILELAVSYGIPITVIIFVSIFLICIFSFKKVFANKSFTQTNFYDRAWFSSFIILIYTQLVDIQYFDGRISIIFWILLAGLKELINTDSLSNKTKLDRSITESPNI